MLCDTGYTWEALITEFTHSYLVAIGIPIAAIVVPALLVWARDLNSQARRLRSLDEQTKIVAFWAEWSKTVSATVPDCGHVNSETEAGLHRLKHEVQRELQIAGLSTLQICRKHIFDAAREFKLTFDEFHAYRATLPWYRRAMLLYKSPNAVAKAHKWGLHIYIWSYFLTILVEIFYSGTRKTKPSPPPRFVVSHPDLSLVILLFSTALLVGLALVPLFVARRKSIAAENDRSNYIQDWLNREESMIRHRKETSEEQA